jgi:hypothetical protein
VETQVSHLAPQLAIDLAFYDQACDPNPAAIVRARDGSGSSFFGLDAIREMPSGHLHGSVNAHHGHSATQPLKRGADREWLFEKPTPRRDGNTAGIHFQPPHLAGDV